MNENSDHLLFETINPGNFSDRPGESLWRLTIRSKSILGSQSIALFLKAYIPIYLNRSENANYCGVKISGFPEIILHDGKQLPAIHKRFLENREKSQDGFLTGWVENGETNTRGFERRMEDITL